MMKGSCKRPPCAQKVGISRWRVVDCGSWIADRGLRVAGCDGEGDCKGEGG